MYQGERIERPATFGKVLTSWPKLPRGRAFYFQQVTHGASSGGTAATKLNFSPRPSNFRLNQTFKLAAGRHFQDVVLAPNVHENDIELFPRPSDGGEE
jgi:hypothetical protein